MIGQKKWRRCALCTAAGAALVLGMSSSASAAPRTVTTKKLASGSTVVSSCATLSVLTVSYAVTAGKISSVTLQNIPPTCVGGLLSMTLSQGTTDVGHAGPTAIATGTLTMVPSILTTSATAPTTVKISIVGP
jgi:hypothetical protein